MEKTFSSLRSFVDVGGKSKFCVDCGNMATQEAYSMKIWLILKERNTVHMCRKEVKYPLLKDHLSELGNYFNFYI